MFGSVKKKEEEEESDQQRKEEVKRRIGADWKECTLRIHCVFCVLFVCVCACE